MTPAQLLILTAAGALLASYAVQRASSADEADPTGEPDWTDEVDAAVSTARNLILPTDAATMQPSPELIAMLKRGEALKLQRYRLDDGGWTNGYGHFWPDGGAVP